jgi:hypothetical protein
VTSLSRETLRGYVLEELLAALIKNTGYRLLVDESQDPDELKSRHNGLAVRGRGGVHQVDVLGELAWIPAFTYPLRLIVEAKARTAKTGIGEVRNAVGVVSDVNQNFTSSAPTNRALMQRFTYRYALFSTAGFSAPAAEYALAHQISLVDLSAGEFDDVVQLADDITTVLSAGGPLRRGDGFLGRLRTRLRIELGTWPEEVPLPSTAGEFDEWPTLSQTIRPRIDAIGELFVGMANGPNLLLLRARDSHRIIQVLERHPVQHVSIHWSPEVEQGTRWSVTLYDGAQPLELSFALPHPVAAWIFDPNADPRRRAMQFKEQFLSTITIYRYVGGRDRLYRLQFSRDQIAESWSRQSP